jgi:hypothetical protein
MEKTSLHFDFQSFKQNSEEAQTYDVIVRSKELENENQENERFFKNITHERDCVCILLIIIFIIATILTLMNKSNEVVSWFLNLAFALIGYFISDAAKVWRNIKRREGTVGRRK